MSLAFSRNEEGSLMEDVTIVEKTPSAEEYNRLRSLVGWGTYLNGVIETSLPRSLYCICAVRDGELIGMARVIGDGGLLFYIQDVIVIPDCQRLGIGTLLMDWVMTFIRANASHNTIVGLMSAKGKEPFYEKYGFTNRPTETLGSGMTIFWKLDNC
jgi:GNAT superfamily N-acetyltransferase